MIATLSSIRWLYWTFVEEYLVISSVYELIDYIILIFVLWLQADHTLGHEGLWFQA